MVCIVVGAVVVITGFVWMFICASAGWSSAWWYFEWAQFKFILGAHLLTGGLLIGLGLRKIFRRPDRTEAPAESPPTPS